MMAVPAESPSMLSSRLKALVTPTIHTTLTSASTALGTPARCASLPIAQTATAAPASRTRRSNGLSPPRKSSTRPTRASRTPRPKKPAS